VQGADPVSRTTLPSVCVLLIRIKCKNNLCAYNEWEEMRQTKKVTRKKVAKKNRIVSLAPTAKFW
jgi:hypothetical protein